MTAGYHRRMASKILFGFHAVTVRLKTAPKSILEIHVDATRRDQRMRQFVERAKEAGAKLLDSDDERLQKMCGTHRHQGVVARVASGEYAELATLVGIPAERGETPFFLALDHVQDPRNFGAILRTAEVFGAHGVIVAKHHQVGLTGATARVAMGALEYIPVARETNLVVALEAIKKSGVWIYGSDVSHGVSPWAADLSGPVCLVLGSEGEGLRPLVARTCDVLLTIPMAGMIGSLNVAAAAAVLCYEVARQRRLKAESP